MLDVSSMYVSCWRFPLPNSQSDALFSPQPSFCSPKIISFVGRLPGWSQTWTASPSGSARDRWGSSRCFWMSWLHTRRPDVSRLTWSWGWGCREAAQPPSIVSLTEKCNKCWMDCISKALFCIVRNHSESSQVCIHPRTVSGTRTLWESTKQGFGIEPMIFYHNSNIVLYKFTDILNEWFIFL